MSIMNRLKKLGLIVLVASIQTAYVNAATVESVSSSAVVQSQVAQTPLVAEQFSTVNINTAEVGGLTNLLGIGQSKAEAIVKYRTKFGAFKTREDLLAVDGIGQATLSKNLDRIALE